MRKIIAIATGLIILMLANYSIYSREQLLENGSVVMLKLAPVDPRSLMQGDYMALRFEITRKAFGRERNIKAAMDGYIVLSLDERKIASFVRMDGGEALPDNMIRMRYRIRAGRAKLATNAFFFQEGTARIYEKAKYGEFRIGADGESILTGMRDENLNLLGSQLGGQ